MPDDRKSHSVYMSARVVQKFDHWRKNHGLQKAEAFEKALEEFMTGTRDESREHRVQWMEDDIREMKSMLHTVVSGDSSFDAGDGDGGELCEEDLIRKLIEDEQEADDRNNHPPIIDTLSTEGNPLDWDGLKEIKELVDEYGELVKLHPNLVHPLRIK